MAQSSTGSTPGGRGGGYGGGYGGQGSPVPYRIGPLAYEPEVKCECGKKACRWIAWSDRNPGRRYLRCRFAQTTDDCGFFDFVDEECSDWYKEVIRDMRDEVWKLKKEVQKMTAEQEAKETEFVAKQMELEEKKKEAEEKQQELNAKQDQLTDKDDALQAMESMMKKKNQCIDALVVMCIMLLICLVVVLLNKP